MASNDRDVVLGELKPRDRLSETLLGLLVVQLAASRFRSAKNITSHFF